MPIDPPDRGPGGPGHGRVLTLGLGEPHSEAVALICRAADIVEAAACETLDELAERAATEHPEFVVIGQTGLGSEVARAVRWVGDVSPATVVLALADGSDEALEARALYAGVQEALSVAEMQADGSQRQEFLSDMLRRARHRQGFVARMLEEAAADPLTGLLDRRGFERQAARALALADRTGAPLLYAAFDVSGLKRINDAFGHAAGDEALRDVADALRATVRSSDLAGRVGGDEFALAAPDASGEHGERIIARLRSALARRGEALGRGWTVDVDAGCAEYLPSAGVGLEGLIKTADARLYMEKSARHATRAEHSEQVEGGRTK